jgi:hypothetical protein
MLRDPVTRLLQEYSHLTSTQLETLLIDYLTDGFKGEYTDFETKASLRSTIQKRKSHSKKKGVSRGAFNRSLAQARRNVIRSIFTLVLLGYLGFFETPSLMRYQKLSETLRSFTVDYDLTVSQKESASAMQIKAIKQAQNQIIALIKELAQPLALKTK